MIIQTHLVCLALRRGYNQVTGADIEQARQKSDRAAHPFGGSVRSEIGGVVLFDPADDQNSRKRFIGDLDIREMLVVFESHVVTRFVFMHEVGFQNQRLHLAVGDHQVQVHHLRHHARGLVVVAVGRLEIGAHPIPEILGLADIDDLAPVILEQVNTR